MSNILSFISFHFNDYVLTDQTVIEFIWGKKIIYAFTILLTGIFKL